ncbi:MAG: glycoside hydrolase family 97 N-terminal domain-containing protein, partial [Prevotella sp.]|nr:glycoside hydrolase family 97 N-terminal domain-containing protein [Prevotella sp.]
MKRIMTIMAMLSLVFGSFAATKTKTLVSPNGKIKVEITIGNRLTLSVFQGDEQILKDCPLSLQLGKEQFGVNPKLSKAKLSKVNEVIKPVVPLKYAEVTNRANQLTLAFKGGISIDLRAYDNGM